MKRICLTLFLFVSGWEISVACAQITYPDSCLNIGFYYRDENEKLDSLKTIKLSESEVLSFFTSNDTLLHLVVSFKNNCNQNISIPSQIRLDMPGQDEFSIEGLRIDVAVPDTLRFNMEYDYLEGAGAGLILAAREIKVMDYWFSLGFDFQKKGRFKFRLRFFNMYNYIPFDQWKYYYSNWIYLTIK